MAMPQRDETIEEIKRLDALLEYAVVHIRLRRRRQVARRSVATGPRGERKRPRDEAAAQDRIASRASSIRAETRNLKADAAAALDAAKRRIDIQILNNK